MFFRYNKNGILWAILIFILSATPGSDMPPTYLWGFIGFDKITHAFFYTILVVLWITGFIRQHSFPSLRFRAVMYAVTFSILYGILIEILQHFFFHEREGDLLDVAADATGCAIGALILYIIYGKELMSKH